MRTARTLALMGLVASLAAAPATGAATRALHLYWIDVEGGAATLIVTPAGESVLIDAGNPGERDARRIHKLATEAAGLRRIDHLIVTHFHRDHFGGVAELVRLLPTGTLYERDLAKAPEAERAQPELEAYKAAAVERRAPLPESLPLRQLQGAPAVSLRVLGADTEFATPPGARDNPTNCAANAPKGFDESDNRNSVVTQLSFGAFRFFDGGDLTWDAEASLVCPKDRTGGPVDVFQIDHHGVDTSNNPVLLKTLRPAVVVVVNNGPRKGGELGTFATLQHLASIRAVYQLHRNLGAPESNTASERIANEGEDCAAQFIRLTVDPSARSYEVWVPSTGHKKSYSVRPR